MSGSGLHRRPAGPPVLWWGQGLPLWALLGLGTAQATPPEALPAVPDPPEAAALEGVPPDAPGQVVPPEALPPVAPLLLGDDVAPVLEPAPTPAGALPADAPPASALPADAPPASALPAGAPLERHAFEQRHMEEAAATLGRRLLSGSGAPTPSALAPVGEVIAFVDFVGFPVFRPGELIPTFLNIFHWQTVEPVIRREILLAPGMPYDADRALESARNLRRLAIFQFVRVDPVRDAEGRLGLLVVTRDLWSLRFEQAFQYTAGQFDALTLQLSERNLFGRNKRATARFNLDPATFALGGLYDDKRVWLGEVHFQTAADVYFTRDDQTYDGLFAHALVERPFFNLSQRWGWDLQVDYLDRTRRQLQAGAVLTWDDPATEAEEAVSRAFAQRTLAISAAARHQLRTGDLIHRFALGLGVFHRRADVIAETNLGDASAEAFRAAVLPRELDQVGPRASWSLFSRRFRTYQDLRSYGISEDARLGPAVTLAVDAPLAALGSTATALRFDAGVGYTLDYATSGLLDGLVAVEGRLEDGALIDRVLLLRGRVASPYLPLGRLVMRVDWLLRDRDTANTFVSLGGHNGLRGYASQAFFGFGADRLRGNLEFRSKPLALSWLHLGLAAFYDVGDVYTRAQDFTLRQSVGLGARVLFPQFNTTPFRVDFGVPVDGPGGFVINFSAGSDQAVPLSPEEDRGSESIIGGFENQP